MESERDRKIRERAYELWVQGGQRDDTSEQNWHQAEQEFAAGSESPDLETAAAPKKATRSKAAPSAAPSTAAPAADGAAAKPARGKAAAKAPSEAAPAKAPRGKPPVEAEKPAEKRTTKRAAKTAPAS
jgi:hypothetical protein